MMLFSGCNQFSALELIHRRVLHTCTEASTVIISGTSYVLPPRSQFLLSNLQDFCDHLYLELAGMVSYLFERLCLCAWCCVYILYMQSVLEAKHSRLLY